MKRWLFAILTFCLLLSGYGSALNVSAHQETPPPSKPVVTIQVQSPCHVLEDRLTILEHFLQASRVYLDGDSLDPRGLADLVTARKSWQSEMSQVGAKLQACLKISVVAVPQLGCHVLEDRLATLGHFLQASRVYLEGDSLNAHGVADLAAARKSWQSEMSRVQIKLQSCLGTRSATASIK